jgi:hypothetical protein
VVESLRHRARIDDVVKAGGAEVHVEIESKLLKRAAAPDTEPGA